MSVLNIYIYIYREREKKRRRRGGCLKFCKEKNIKYSAVEKKLIYNLNIFFDRKNGTLLELE